MSGLLSLADRGRLAKVCGMLGSDHAGERAAAALHATRLLQQAGVTWEEFVGAGQPVKDDSPDRDDWRALARACLLLSDELTAWEEHFLTTLLRRRSISVKQSKCLAGIAERLGVTAA